MRLKVDTPIVEEPKEQLSKDFDPTHVSIFDTMREGGYVVEIKKNQVKLHVAGLLLDHQKNRRRGFFSATTDNTEPHKPNCWAFPLADGGLLVFRYKMTSDTSDWKWSEEKQKLYCLYNVKPDILITANLEEMVDKVETALGQHSNIYQKGTTLVELTTPPKKPSLCVFQNESRQLLPLSTDAIRLKAAHVATFKKHNKKDAAWYPCFPPLEIVNAVSASTRYEHIPSVTGISFCPVLRQDGSIAAEPGYDEQTGLFLDIRGKYPPVPSVNDAKVLLDDALFDFPFTEKSHQSAALALLLSLLCRQSYPGPTPFFPILGNLQGVGKGLLTNIVTGITQGFEASRYSWPESEDERRKLITTIGMSGSPYLCLDNLVGRFGGPTIAAALTASMWEDRLLGLNKRVTIPITFVTMATGNNCTFTSDLPRRSVSIKMLSTLEEPSKRRGFKHSPLLTYIAKERAKLVMAALSIPYYYIQAKSPDQKLAPFGSYEAWSDLVRSSLVWAGYADCDTRTDLVANNDDEQEQLRQLVAGWEELGCVCTVAAALETVEKAPTLKALLQSLPRGRESDALGKLLRNNQNRTVDGKRIVKGEKSKVTRWKVEVVPSESDKCTK